MVANINDKDAAALERLEAERARRLQEKIDSGEVVSVQTTVVVEASDENTEGACERHLASLPTSTPDGRPIHYDLLIIVTGVPRGPHLPGQWVPPQTASSEGTTDHPDEETTRSGEVLSSPSSPSQPTYVKVTIRNGDEDDPGQIAEACYTIEDGAVVLRDADDKHIASRLLKDEDPAAVARALLREAEEPKDFNRPIHYPKLGLA
jgi:hypothetical protein